VVNESNKSRLANIYSSSYDVLRQVSMPLESIVIVPNATAVVFDLPSVTKQQCHRKTSTVREIEPSSASSDQWIVERIMK
jgi:hypothetical protein